MLVLDVGDVPQEPVIYRPSEVPVLVTSTSSTSSLALEHHEMKTKLGFIGSHLLASNTTAKLAQVTEKSTAAQERPAERRALETDVKPGRVPPGLSPIPISEPTRLGMLSYADFFLKKKNQ